MVLMTCGSDFHGKNKPNIKLGATGCEDQDEEIIKSLKDRIRDNRKRINLNKSDQLAT